MSFEEYLKTYGTEYIEAVAFKFYKYYFYNNKICDYEDFVQICLMKLFEQWKAWDSNKCQANTFIFTIIKYIYIIYIFHYLVSKTTTFNCPFI